MQIYYASRDGQSRKIAAHIAGRLAARGIAATPVDLAADPPSAEKLAAAKLVVAVLSIRYGKHLPEGLQFVEMFRSLDRPPPLALASVNLTARKPGKDTAEGNVYLRKLIAVNELKPAVAAAFAGRLDYPRYGFLDKLAIRFIMLITGGPTDPSTVVEYTQWDRVDAFAAKLAEISGAEKGE
ncbi:Protoporphyrinogen IX oxidase, oxygen-independent, HemG [Rhodovulum sp. PH10]|uniref:menaquinone-dependent protoporphyrinogen IX dehydrogenase n=1 Tax=Rhodovulum sp. PH10 TaxID=1187851 RepID=UPI00027C2BB9|nr:menaquinone-dependent protoporphyrinogen IX dehydrogenase [Rhodovulum sp. PH10]EJW10583.1 Protoporphyrinogen IX oxidase, oxygen-independent, HemG [Rhodovulum sp. PH10]